MSEKTIPDVGCCVCGGLVRDNTVYYNIIDGKLTWEDSLGYNNPPINKTVCTSCLINALKKVFN